jgi:hypothetical protein
MKPFLAAALLATLLCGCATKEPPNASADKVAADQQNALRPSPLAPDLSQPEPTGSSQVVQATLPPGITGPINGIYQGRERVIQANSPLCPPPQLGLIEIGDGNLLFPYTSSLIYTVAIPPDGKLHAAMGDTTLDGQLAGGDLDFIVTTPDCKSSFSFTRRPGF